MGWDANVHVNLQKQMMLRTRGVGVVGLDVNVHVMVMMMMMMTLMKLVNSATKFRHEMDKFLPTRFARFQEQGRGYIYILYIYMY